MNVCAICTPFTLCGTSTEVGSFLRGNYITYRPDFADRNNTSYRDALGNTLWEDTRPRKTLVYNDYHAPLVIE